MGWDEHPGHVPSGWQGLRPDEDRWTQYALQQVRIPPVKVSVNKMDSGGVMMFYVVSHVLDACVTPQNPLNDQSVFRPSNGASVSRCVFVVCVCVCVCAPQQVCNPMCWGRSILSQTFTLSPTPPSALLLLYPQCPLATCPFLVIRFCLCLIFPSLLNPLPSWPPYLHSVNCSLSGWWGKTMMRGRWATRTAAADSQQMTWHQSKNGGKRVQSTVVENGESSKWKEIWWRWPL